MPFDNTNLAYGDYTALYNNTDIGLFEGPVRASTIWSAQDIMADRYGDTVIDGVYRGGNHFITMIIKEWNADIRAILNPFDGTIGESGIMGRSMVDLAKVLKFTAQPGTRAATEGPATRTYDLAIISPQHNIELLMGNVQRDVPLVMRAYPKLVSAGSTLNEVFWFVDT